jgi:hypothetical protein
MHDFFGLPIGSLENDLIQLEYLTTAGPRIVRFSKTGAVNLLAELPQFNLDTVLGPFYFRGGHRLWCSPERMPETYAPDNEGLIVERIEQGVRLIQPMETGITKRVEVQLTPDRAEVTLTHYLFNSSESSVRISPWAITMFRLGGTVILPQPVGNVDSAGLLHNRILALWPYTRIHDPRLVLRDDFIMIKAGPAMPPAKIGYYNPHGWLAYWLDGILFRKTFEIHPDEEYPDGGCNAESYVNDRFVELESLGPLSMLEPGSSTSLKETWELFDTLDVPFISDQMRELIS